MKQPEPEYDAFVSYSWKDKPFVDELVMKLGAAGYRIYQDAREMAKADDLEPALYDAIDDSYKFMVVVSPDSAASAMCAKELAHARSRGKDVIPIIRREVDGAAMDAALASKNWIFFREADDADAALAEVREAIELDRDHARRETRILARARDWDAHGRHGGYTMHGPALTEAEQWQAEAATKATRPDPLLAQYINASRRADGRRRVIERAALAVMAVLLVAASAGGIFSFTQFQQARANLKTALSRQLAAQAVSHLDDQLDLSLLLGVESYRMQPTVEAKDSLLRSLQQEPRLLSFLPTTGRTAAFSDDGRMLAIGGLDGHIVLWSMETHRSVGKPLLAHTKAVDELETVLKGTKTW